MQKSTTRKVAPRVSDQTWEFLASTFDTANAGAEYILSSWQSLYKRTLHDLRHTFSAGELSLMLDVANGAMLTPGMAGQHLEASMLDAIDLDGAGEKWGVDRTELKDKMYGLTVFEVAVLEIWAAAFWSSGAYEGESGLSAWIVDLL